MQVNSIGMVNSRYSTSFGQKNKNEKKHNNTNSESGTVPVSANSLWLALLALTMIGGGLTTGCDPVKSSNPVSPIDTTKTVDTTSTVQKKLQEMVKVLGLATTDTTYFSTNSAIKSGDIVGFNYINTPNNSSYTMTINEDKSTNDTIVYNEVYKDRDKDTIYNLRQSYSLTSTGSILRKSELKNGDNYEQNGTMEYVIDDAEKKIDAYVHLTNGTTSKIFTYIPNTKTSVIRKSATTDQDWAIDSINITTKK